MHKVKCFYCGGTFDRDKIPFVKINERRYAHQTCAEEQSPEVRQEVIDKEEFWQCIKTIFGPKYNYMMINRQATNFINEYGYTWSGMTKSLQWFFIINHGSKEKGNEGIGILPFIYDKAKEYYYNIYLAELKNKEVKEMRQVVDFDIQSPRAWQRPPHLLDLGE